MAANELGKSTEERLKESILKVQSASIGKQILHLSHAFTEDPKGYFGVVSTFVVCEDELAIALHKRLDATVREFFAEHGVEFNDGLDGDSEPDNVIPIFGIHEKKDGSAYLSLWPEVNERLNLICERTGMNREDALSMALEGWLEKKKPEIEQLKREEREKGAPRESAE